MEVYGIMGFCGPAWSIKGVSEFLQKTKPDPIKLNNFIFFTPEIEEIQSNNQKPWAAHLGANDRRKPTPCVPNFTTQQGKGDLRL